MTSTNETPAEVDGKPKRPPRPNTGRPNYNYIHRFPLPVKIDPLPPLIPHNPLSVLTIVFVWMRSTFWSTASPVVYTGTFSPESRSVHVTDHEAIRVLWEAGFFGKGTLSRSEPTWLDREKRKKGLTATETSEEVTRKRRQERKKFKEDRALKEQETIVARLKLENGNPPSSNQPSAASSSESALEGVPSDDVQAAEKGLSEFTISAVATDDSIPMTSDIEIVDLEHLQLTLEEAFFLAYGLGVLKVVIPSKFDPSGYEQVPQASLFTLFRMYYALPPVFPEPSAISPDDLFVANYAVYHHFRSLGWVIRPGPKFGVDWMLYNRGPPFSHAEFAVMTIKSYSHAFWKTKEGRKMLADTNDSRAGKTWHWVHMINRVQSQVKKTLVLAYVEMPPPLSADGGAGGESRDFEPPTSVFQRMKVREVILRRWVPNRQRD